jgi:hypothetical protein
MLRLSDLNWPRMLYTRTASILLGIAALFSIAAIYIRYSDFDLNKLGRVQFELVSYLGALSALGFFTLLVCMAFFWLRCDTSSKLNRTIWFIILLLGFAYGSQVVYYLLVYLPAVIKRLRNRDTAALAAPLPLFENPYKVIGPFGWVLLIGWGLLALFVAAAFTFPKAMSHLFGSIAWAIVLWPASLLIATAIYIVVTVFRVGLRRPARRSSSNQQELP